MNLNIFTALKPLHIDGRKEQSSHAPILDLPVAAIPHIYFPLVGPNGAPVKLHAQVGDRVSKGQLLAERVDMTVPIFSSVSGHIKQIVSLYHPIIGRQVDHFMIVQEPHPHGVMPLKPLSMEATQSEIIEQMKRGGLTGLGGSGFPAYIKYQSAVGKPIDYVLINGVECEPYLSTDYQVAQHYAKELLIGSELCRIAAGAKEAIITFKRSKVAIKEALLPLISAYPHLRIQTVPDVYPMGWERTLVKQVLNRTYDKFPTEASVVVSNLTTAIAVHDLVILGQPVLSRIITMSGAGLTQQVNVRVPVGALMHDVVEAIGGYALDQVTAFIGGPMSAKAVKDDRFAIQQHFGGYTVLAPVASQEEACLRCGACTSNCPAHLQPIEIKLALDSHNVARLLSLDAMKCVECGICTYVCPSKIEVTEAVRQGKAKTKIALATGKQA
jgi:Na+-translocating ferredoxin:NAD+ oxidoreductase subunit C